MKKFLALFLAAVLLLGLAACGGSANTDGSSASNSATPNSNAGSNAPANTGSGTAPSYEGGTLKVALSTNDGSTTDDHVPTPWMNHNLATNLMFRTLFIADASLTKVSPELAEGYEISSDALTYTIQLKDGLKWSDGEPLTLEDVIWSIEMVQQATRKNTIYSAAFSNIEEMTADGNTLTLKLSKPYVPMMDVIAQFAILPKHCLEDQDGDSIDSCAYWVNPVTSGYYMVDEFNVGNYFTLKPNPNYEGQTPKIEKVTVSFVTDFLTAAQGGAADFLYGNATDLVTGIGNLSNFTSFPVDVLFYKYFIFNMKGVDGNQNEAMQNVEVRKAIIEAVDRATLATLYPNASVLNSGVPNTNDAYNGYVYEYNADKAKADVAASGYDLSRTLKICYYNNDQTSIDLINTAVYYLEQAGFTVEATLSNDGTTDLFTTRDYDVGFKGLSAFSMTEWYSEYLSSSATFSNIFGGEDTFDDAVAALNTASTTAERTAALKTLQEMEQEYVYKVPFFTIGNYVFVSNNVNLPAGVEFCNPLYINDIDYANWTIN